MFRDADDTLLHFAPLSLTRPHSNCRRASEWRSRRRDATGPASLAQIGAAVRTASPQWLPAGFLFHLMVDERLADLKPLRQLLAGGDVLSVEHLIRARRALPDCRLINGYGPTENTTFTCCYTVIDERKLIPTVPIGRPIANTRVYVLDPSLQPVPVGVVGELCAGGDGVARGYWQRPELSAERFIADPHVNTPGARMYRTGDRARYLPDGNIEFLGRADIRSSCAVSHRAGRDRARARRAQRGAPGGSACARRCTDKRLVAYVPALAGA
jgi:hypothetical protein